MRDDAKLTGTVALSPNKGGHWLRQSASRLGVSNMADVRRVHLVFLILLLVSPDRRQPCTHPLFGQLKTHRLPYETVTSLFVEAEHIGAAWAHRGGRRQDAHSDDHMSWSKSGLPPSGWPRGGSHKCARTARIRPFLALGLQPAGPRSCRDFSLAVFIETHN